MRSSDCSSDVCSSVLMERADMDLRVAATEKDVVMVEGEMKECAEGDLVEALKLAHEAIKIQVRAQLELAELVGKPKREYSHETNDEELRQQIKTELYDKIYQIARSGSSKQERTEQFKALRDELLEAKGEIEEKIGRASCRERVCQYVEISGVAR